MTAQSFQVKQSSIETAEDPHNEIWRSVIGLMLKAMPQALLWWTTLLLA
jgi:hypothetical protein